MDKEGFDNLKRILKGKDPKKNLQVGYDKKVNSGPTRGDRKPGDTWEENGKTWTITENGTIQNVTRLDKFRVPFRCPECKNVMKGKKDRKAYFANETCLNCMIDYHEELKKAGKFKQFAFRKRLLDAKSWIRDQLEQLDEFKEQIKENPEFVHSDGTVEEWDNQMDSEKIIEEYEEFLDGYRSDLNDSIQKYEEDYGESLDEWTEPE